ncbi:MAG: hypothetical protein GWN09_03055, partial [Gammaproteobacteria bacterium]|nr:hypothetical protein [Gammaproteobacteria bacterium]
GYDLVGIINAGGGAPLQAAGAPELGQMEDLPDVIDEQDVQEVIVALPEGASRHEIVRVVSMSQRGSVAIKVFPDVFEFITTG